MAHFHIETKKGNPYRYVREIARVEGRPKVISQIYIGSPERIAGFARGTDTEVQQLKVEKFGALCLTYQIDQDIDLCRIIDTVIAPAGREKGGVVCGLNKTKERLTVVIDKGMNADGNYFAWIDEHARIHFITTYSK